MGPMVSERYQKISDAIKDCDILIAGRMGFDAYTDMRSFGLEVICTDVKDIDEAVSLYLTGKLTIEKIDYVDSRHRTESEPRTPINT